MSDIERNIYKNGLQIIKINKTVINILRIGYAKKMHGYLMSKEKSLTCGTQLTTKHMY